MFFPLRQFFLFVFQDDKLTSELLFVCLLLLLLFFKVVAKSACQKELFWQCDGLRMSRHRLLRNILRIVFLSLYLALSNFFTEITTGWIANEDSLQIFFFLSPKCRHVLLGSFLFFYKLFNQNPQIVEQKMGATVIFLGGNDVFFLWPCVKLGLQLLTDLVSRPPRQVESHLSWPESCLSSRIARLPLWSPAPLTGCPILPLAFCFPSSR